MNECVKGSVAQMGISLREARQRILNSVVLHPHFETAKRELMNELAASNLVWLIGPAGVGKSWLVKHLVQEWNRPVENDPFCLRSLAIRAPSSHGPVYPWSSVYKRILLGLQDPLPGYKVDHENRVKRLKEGKAIRIKGLTDDLRESVFDAVGGRGTETVFIDEAVNLLGNRRGRALVPQLDILRDFVDGVGCKVVLVCTPRILEIFEELESDGEKGAKEGLTCEITRRMDKVYFHRYGLDEHRWKEDFRNFKGVVRDIFLQLPDAFRPKFSDKELKHLQAETLGCVGLFVKRLIRMLVLCESEGAQRLEWRHVEKTPFSDGDWKRWERWCKFGEEMYARDQECSGVGLERRLESKPKESASGNGAGDGRANNRNRRRPRQRGVGKPNPSRPSVPKREK